MKKNFNKHKKFYLSILIIMIVIVSILFYFFGYDQYGIPKSLVSYQFVHSRPEGTLFYPNGKLYAPNGRGMIDGHSVAWSGAIMTSNDPPEKIYKWYEDWLLAHGWRKDNSFGALISTQKSEQTYSRSGTGDATREVFHVAIDDPKMLGETLGKKFPTNITIFEFSYDIR